MIKGALYGIELTMLLGAMAFGDTWCRVASGVILVGFVAYGIKHE